MGVVTTVTERRRSPLPVASPPIIPSLRACFVIFVRFVVRLAEGPQNA